MIFLKNLLARLPLSISSRRSSSRAGPSFVAPLSGLDLPSFSRRSGERMVSSLWAGESDRGRLRSGCRRRRSGSDVVDWFTFVSSPAVLLLLRRCFFRGRLVPDPRSNITDLEVWEPFKGTPPPFTRSRSHHVSGEHVRWWHENQKG